MVALAAAMLTASPQTAKRSLEAHISRPINVKGFGATGDGVTDDYADITAAMNWNGSGEPATIYFPPGTYKISAPLELLLNGKVMHLMGDVGTTITGNFNDFLIKYVYNASAQSGAERGVIERLTLINTHATGGGIQYGTCTGGMIRDCIITANKGINTTIDDNLWIAFEVSILNCHMDPGSNPTNSYGVTLGSDGVVTNCTFTGLAVGAFALGGQGCMHLNGCLFEECASGLRLGASLLGQKVVTQCTVTGSRFVNCGIAFSGASSVNSNSRILGCRIEATEGTISGNPQYGIRDNSNYTRCLVGGISVVGQYQQAAVSIVGGQANSATNFYAGISAVNTGTLGGAVMVTPTTPTGGGVVASTAIPKFSFSVLRARHITAASWSGGTATLTTSAAHGMFPSNIIIVQGITVGGSTANDFNGTFAVATGSGSTITYALPSDPGAAVTTKAGLIQTGGTSTLAQVETTTWSGGVVTLTTDIEHAWTPGSSGIITNVLVGGSTANGYNGTFSYAANGFVATGPKTLQYNVGVNPGTSTVGSGAITITNTSRVLPNVLTTNTYSITDCNTAVWGASAAGSGSNHVKVRWNGYDWTVVGK